MKTKNILKIGVLSIVLFALLISPILKFTTPEAKANGDIQTCVSQEGYCEAQREACKPGYVEDESLICPSGVGKPKCCNLAANVEYSGDRARTQWTYEAQVRVAEEKAADMCRVVSENWKTECAEMGGWYCTIAAPFIGAWCVITKAILEGLGKMFTVIINLEINWILWALDSRTYGGFTTNDGVIQIWGIMRNLTNALLILGLIGIAIATIVGYKKYAWQNTLWKLAIVALLVNFSLVIGGMILDVSNYLSGYFLSIAQEENESLAPSFLEGFGYTKKEEKIDIIEGDENSVTATTTVGYYDPPSLFGDEKYSAPEIVGADDPKDAASYTLRFGQFFVVSFITILVGGFAVIALLAIFITIIFRTFIVIMLLAVSPIVFATWIFPDTEKFWKMWWEQFIKWSFFPVIFAFMLWIGLFTINHTTWTGAGVIDSILRMTLFSMFLVGGLIFSIQGGGAVAQTVTKQAGKLGLAAGAFVGTKMKGKIVESPTYKKAGQALTKVPLLKGVGEEMMVAGEKAKVARVKEHQKNFENVSTNTLKQITEGPLASPLIERDAFEKQLAATNELTKRKKLEDKNIPFIDRYKDDPRLDTETIAKAVPHFFKIENDKLVRTGDKIEEKVQALSRHKGPVLAKETQNSNFIKSIVSDAGEKAKREGKTLPEIEKAKDEAFDETIQEIFKTLSPAQSAGFVQGLSPKDLIEEKWGGSGGKIEQAIKKDEQTKKRFYEELLPASRVLREYSGIKEEKKEKKDETPPQSGYFNKDGIWTSQ